MSEFEYIRQTTLRLIKKNFLQNCNLSSNEAIKVWSNWVIVNRIREKQIDEFLPTENLENDNKTVSLLIEKGIPEELAINFYSSIIQQCQRWKYQYNFYCADCIPSSYSYDENAITIYSINKIPLRISPDLQEILILEDINASTKDINTKDISTSTKDINTKDIKDINTSIKDIKDINTKDISTSTSTSTKDIKDISTKDKGDRDNREYDGNMEIIIDYRGISNKVDKNTIKKLLKFYRGSEKNVKFNIWKLLNCYSLLDGLSYQWSLPLETFEFLYTKCNLKAELFASPLNHHINNYYSLFEIDRIFGSSGDFFQSTYKDFMAGGFYEANPPFIESVFVQASQLILNYLKCSEERNINLAFMWIMPDWLDSFAYQRLKKSTYLKTELVFHKNQHKYWEYRKNRIIQANFNTHVLILASNNNYYSSFWNKENEKIFIKSMSY